MLYHIDLFIKIITVGTQDQFRVSVSSFSSFQLISTALWRPMLQPLSPSPLHQLANHRMLLPSVATAAVVSASLVAASSSTVAAKACLQYCTGTSNKARPSNSRSAELGSNLCRAAFERLHAQYRV